MKSEVYSWRLDPELKHELEDAAHAEKISVAALIERATRDWLERRALASKTTGEDEMRARIMKYAGTMEIGLGPYTNKRVREFITSEIEARHANKKPS